MMTLYFESRLKHSHSHSNWSAEFLMAVQGITLFVIASSIALSGCGRAGSRLLRQGQLPVYDFPMYLTEGSTGTVWKYATNSANRESLVTGLNNPLGIATDRYNNLYVVEAGSGIGRLLKVNVQTGTYSVVSTELKSASVVAVDSFGDAYVTQEETSTHNIIRASDKKVMANFLTQPTALAIGVSDTFVIGDYSKSTVYWGTSASGPSTTTSYQPVNIAMDGVGRIFVAEGRITDARVMRYNQTEPGGEGKVVAENLNGPRGIAVDPVGNIYVVENTNGRIVLVTDSGDLYNWRDNLTDPQYIAFTQY